MSRIVNRVPTLRTPDPNTNRMLADIEQYGFDNWLNMMITLYGDAVFDGSLQHYGYESIDDILAPFYAGIPDNQVLEMGCGDARNTD